MVKVSVIVPVYNVEEYLASCLESILNQTYRDLEILCINDCSTDNSRAILKEYQQKDARMTILDNERNGGLAHTRNVGIGQATGEYILFVDSDDVIASDPVESCMNVAPDNDMVCFDYRQVMMNHKTAIRQYAYKMKDGEYSGDAYFTEAVRTESIIFSAWSKFFSCKFLTENQIQFYEGILYEDMLFSFQCFIKAKKIYSLNLQLYEYRIRETSIMTTGVGGKNIESYIISICEIMKLYVKDDFSREMDRAVEGYIRKVCREYISVFRKWGNREFEPVLLKDKPEYLKLYRTFSELFIHAGKRLYISPEQVEKMRQYQYVILYGAGDIARSTIEILDQYDILLHGIAVSDLHGNRKSLLGNPIRELQEYYAIREKSLVLIGTIPRYYSEIQKQLLKQGFMEWMEMIEVSREEEDDR